MDELGRATVPPPGRFVKLSSSLRQTCGVRADATLAGWGAGSSVLGPPSGTLSQVSVGPDRACAVSTTGSLACWGHLASEPPPIVLSGAFSDGSVGTNGTLACWGPDAWSTGVPSGRFASVAVGGNGTGGNFACAISTGAPVPGALWCWGAILRQQPW